MKTWLRNALEVLAVILLVPQAFVFLYYFRHLFLGSNWEGLLKSLPQYALTISWVSAPFLTVLALAVKALIRTRVRWTASLLFSVAAGYAWVAAWNLLVFPVFSYVSAALPVLLCSLGFSGYAAARALYLESLVPQPPYRYRGDDAGEAANNEAADLSE